MSFGLPQAIKLFRPVVSMMMIENIYYEYFELKANNSISTIFSSLKSGSN